MLPPEIPSSLSLLHLNTHVLYLPIHKSINSKRTCGLSGRDENGQEPGILLGRTTDTVTKMSIRSNQIEPGAETTRWIASFMAGRSSAGIPMTISSSAIPENFRDPSQPREMFGFPVR